MTKTSLILLAGGIGSRMQTTQPKQYLMLMDKPIAYYSLELFLSLPEISEVIIVANPLYHSLFQPFTNHTTPIKFAFPGLRRQDSVYSGLEQVANDSDFICIHDAARPFVSKNSVKELLKEGYIHKAATLAVPLKFTVKQSGPDGFVHSTLDRNKLFEIQTPQILSKTILSEGFAYANQHNLTVTDDVSLAELIEKPVKLVEGSYLNIKITTPEDLLIAPHLYKQLVHG